MKTWLLENRAAMIKAFFAALVIPLTLVLVALEIYFANVFQMSGNPGDVFFSVFFLSAIGTFLFFAIQLPFLKYKFSPWIATTLLTLGFFLWFQAHVLNWNFGYLDGRSIPWKSYRSLGVAELFGYGVICVVATRFQRKLFTHLILVSCGLIFIQAVPVSFTVAKTLFPKNSLRTEEQGIPFGAWEPSWKRHSLTYDGFFEFSQEENVVLIVLDTLGQKLVEDIQKDYPEEIEETFQDFTCFTSTMSNVPATVYNIPQILTGCQLEEMERWTFETWPSLDAVTEYKLYNQDKTLLKTLSENQYRCDIHAFHSHRIYFDSHWMSNVRLNQNDRQESILVRTEMAQLMSLALFRSVPILLKRSTIKRAKPYYQPLTDDEIGALARSSSRTSFANRKTLKYLHLVGAHPPFTMDENGEKNELFGIESQRRQARGSLRVVRNILEMMKESGVYDQSLIIVMADHGDTGLEYELAPASRKHPSFFVKRKQTRQSQMAYNDNPIHIRDTTPIILSELGILTGEDAFSPFDMPESLVKERRDQWKQYWSTDVNGREIKTLEKEWLKLIALRPSQPLPKGHPISPSEIQREHLSIQEGSVLQVDIRGDRVPSVMFDKSWTTTVTFTPSDQSGNSVFVSEKAVFIIPDGKGEPVESWVCFQKLKVDTLPDGQYQIDVFFQKGSSTSQWKASRILSVTTDEKGEKVFELLAI